MEQVLKNLKKNQIDRFFDVGIAEQHEFTFSVGFAKEIMTLIISIYSLFLSKRL